MGNRQDAQKFGTFFEKKIADMLKEMTLNTCSNSYRYPDQKSTRGGYSNKQPADFFCLVNGNFYNLECKASITETDFRKAYKGLLKDHQLTSARKVNRAGGRYYVLFHSKFSSDVEVWDSRDLLEPYSTPRMKLEASPVALLNIKDGYDKWHPELLRLSHQKTK